MRSCQSSASKAGWNSQRLAIGMRAQNGSSGARYSSMTRPGPCRRSGSGCASTAATARPIKPTAVWSGGDDEWPPLTGPMLRKKVTEKSGKGGQTRERRPCQGGVHAKLRCDAWMHA